MKTKTTLKSIILILSIFMLLPFGFTKHTSANTEASTDTLFTEINNARIAYKTFGKGEQIIMCVGYASNKDLWNTNLIVTLSKDYKVIVFDYRGMGYSSNEDSTFTIKTLADDVNELMKSLDISQAHILGWSMGGYVAQIFAINYPEKVKKLVLYATDPGDKITINPSEKIIEILTNPKSSPEDLLNTLFPDDWLAKHPEPWKVLPHATEAYHAKTIGLQYEAIAMWLEPGGGSAGQLHQLKMPVLLICGNKDKVVPCQNSNILHDSISSSTLINVNNSGHGMMFQIPNTFSSYVLTFLNEE